jgi:hypothetical protein
LVCGGRRGRRDEGRLRMSALKSRRSSARNIKRQFTAACDVLPPLHTPFPVTRKWVATAPCR